MALEFLGSLTTVGGIIALLVQILVIWVVVMLADKVIEHKMEAKRSLILAALAYFISPLILAFGGISIPYAGLIIPLIVWVALSEVLFKKFGTFMSRMKVAAVAFVIYLILTILGVPSMIAGAIGF